jgi:3-hydroxyacyl-[acyl-carrier-protein] dehydratase
MPGVLMIESMAQTAAIMAFDMTDALPDEKTVFYFAGVDGARFKRPVEPGDQLILDVEMDRVRGGIYKFNARALVADELAAEAVLMCTMRTIA